MISTPHRELARRGSVEVPLHTIKSDCPYLLMGIREITSTSSLQKIEFSDKPSNHIRVLLKNYLLNFYHIRVLKFVLEIIFIV